MKEDNVIDRAISHYKATCSDQEKTIEVPEWGTEEEALVIYYTPLTLKQIQLLQQKSTDDFDRAARIVVMKSKNADGSNIFKRPIEDKIKLMNSADASVVSRIAAIIGGRNTQITEEDEMGE